ncbi:MAG TPA: hypothetical protein VH062_13835 [Polyangiaceae bacterium]|jgi:hypothetical protein|nr:hypothetical protein [Polyangiaceae bacterium]
MARLSCVLALVVVALAAVSRPAMAAGQISTCVSVEAPDDTRDALQRLVTNEVSRHPTHRVSDGACETRLRVELIEIRGDRFLTGRVDGEVPQRIVVDGKDGRALERAVTDLARVVLGNDPVVLRAPGEQSFFAARVLELRDTGQNTFDAGAVETMSFVDGRATFQPGLMFGYTRELSAWQLGVEASFAQRLATHPGKMDLDSLGRLQITGALYFSKQADTSAFVGVSLGLGYERFTGPRGAGLGKGDGEYSAVGPGLGLRAGVEAFRSTTTRVTLFGEAFIPMFVANDEETEIVKSWVPTLSLTALARF